MCDGKEIERLPADTRGITHFFLQINIMIMVRCVQGSVSQKIIIWCTHSSVFCCCCFVFVLLLLFFCLLYLGADYFTCSFTLAIYRFILVSIYLLIYLCVYLLICRVIYLFCSFIYLMNRCNLLLAHVLFRNFLKLLLLFCLSVLFLYFIVLCGKFGSPYPIGTAAARAALLILTSV